MYERFYEKVSEKAIHKVLKRIMRLEMSEIEEVFLGSIADDAV